MTTAYERLMAEAIPTGRFGDPDPDRGQARTTPAAPSTPQQQAARRAALDQAQHGWRLPDEASERKRERSRDRKRAARPRHLRLVPNPTDTEAA